MDAIDAILSRRTVREMLDTPLSDEIVDLILNAAIWAPNHKLTEPWRFVVLGPESRLALAQGVVDYKSGLFAGAVDIEAADRMKDRVWQRFIRVGAIVAVTCVSSPKSDSHRKRDDLAAVCAAIQNIQLAAWSQGVGACWVNGTVSHMAKTAELLQLNEHGELLVGIISLGYPARAPDAGRRTPAAAFTRTLP